MKKVICFFICVCFMMQSIVVFAEGNTDLGLNAKSAILMEEATGNILYESNPDERLPIASVTKVMTMLLIMEAVDSGKISLDDMVTVSENAMSYGGSTMFLETGEQLTVNDMLKGIAVASANDGCVAMAEHLAGSESAFVDMMNEKAKGLGMENTHFMNTNGLDEDDHYSSARDVAIMSRELMKHETIFNYTSIWMDTLRGGKFQLANTNKLIRFYDGANGLKTGSTSKALCCLSAAAKRNDMQLIAVVLGAPTSAERFASAKSLLDYGFANYAVNTQITAGDEVQKIAVEKGVDKEVGVVAGDSCSTLVKKGQEDNITKEIKIDETITAPIEAGQKIGTMTISRDGEVIADIDLNALSAVEKKGIGLIIKDFFATIFFGSNNDIEENSEI
ncbi:D-alanyl-D-alanine carboxypeptidase family protein [Hominilimicola sp.]|uniref:D-alanyl-D-alanine carboxypeptidase family protein n=1 Tax=Hominilimicola sp. TaxID=3073571 RepID=UPI00307ECF03